MITRSEIATGRAREYALPEYAIPAVKLQVMKVPGLPTTATAIATGGAGPMEGSRPGVAASACQPLSISG